VEEWRNSLDDLMLLLLLISFLLSEIRKLLYTKLSRYLSDKRFLVSEIDEVMENSPIYSLPKLRKLWSNI